MADPFPYQQPVGPEQVIDRDGETQRLLELADSGMLVRLDAPRRYGKTSLVGRVFHEAGKQGTVGILVDLKGVLTLTDVIVRIGRAYAELRGPLARLVRPVVSGVEAHLGVQIAGVGAGVRLSPPQRGEEASLFALLDLPKQFTEKGWRRAIVCFDEFQDVLAVPAADDKMRSVIQHQPEAVSYVFAGSQPRLMNELFATRERAFWSQAERVELAPLDLLDCSLYIADRFTETRKESGDALGPLLRTGQGHPQRTMLLASKLWSHTPARGTATIQTWDRALADAQLQVEPELDAVWRNQSQTEQRILRAVVLNDGRPYQKPAPQAVGVPPGSIDSVTKTLVGETVLRQVEPGRFEFVDPLFALYVRDLGT